MAKLTSEELASLIERQAQDSIGYFDSEITDQRQLNLDYYYGRPYGNEVEGRSEVVTTEVADTIESIMPSLMRVFFGGDQVVQCKPRGPEDQAVAEQASDYANYVLMDRNEGFKICYEWFKASLLNKNSFVKVWWDTESRATEQEYAGLTDDEMALIGADENVEILEHTGYQGQIPTPQGAMPVQLHDIRVRKTEKSGKTCIKGVPPEEVLIGRGTTDLRSATFVAHRTLQTVSDLIEMGYDPKQLEEIPSFGDLSLTGERVNRLEDEEGIGVEVQPGEGQTRLVERMEAYIRVDQDGDGVAELRKVALAGNQILRFTDGREDNEVVDWCGIISLTPIIMPYKFFGYCPADQVRHLQFVTSTLLRQILDNMYLTNSPRMGVVTNMVNLDDLMDTRAGRVVRMKTPNAVTPLTVPFFGAPAFSMLEYLESLKEKRTGITRYNQGLDADSLNKTARGISAIMQASQQRLELIARVIAETGFKELIWAILEMASKYGNKAEIIRLRNRWVQVDPRGWENKFDLSVNVGLGFGAKETQAQMAQMVLQLQMGLKQTGSPLVDDQKIYNTTEQLLKGIGWQGTELFFNDPSLLQEQGKMPQLPPPPEMVKIQADMQKAQMDDKLQRDLAMLRSKVDIMIAQLRAQDNQASVDKQTGASVATSQAQIEAQRESEMRKVLADLAKFQDQLTSDRQEGGEEREHGARMEMAKHSMEVETTQQAMKPVLEVLKGISEQVNESIRYLQAPRRIVKDQSGKPVGVEIEGFETRPITRDAKGNVTVH